MGMTGLKEFNKELNKFTKELLPFQVALVQKKIAMEALKRLVLRTAVDEGVLRGDWQVGVNFVPDTPKNTSDKSGESTINAEMSKLMDIPAFSIVFIANNQNYADVIDQGLFDPPDPGPSKDKRPDRQGKTLVRGGYSVQSPDGMVEVTIRELTRMFP